jgi:hypothetical protein
MQSVTSNAVAESLGVITRLTETPTVIGKWTDGVQDIKRAVLSIVISANNESIMSFDLQTLFRLNIIENVRISGCTSVATTASSSFNFPLEFNYGGGWSTSLFYNTADHILYIQRGSAVYTKTSVYYIWLEYV